MEALLRPVLQEAKLRAGRSVPRSSSQGEDSRCSKIALSPLDEARVLERAHGSLNGAPRQLGP